jgi:predicted nucleic acid-binding protein
MDESAVVNASPLIFLSRGGLVDFLRLSSHTVVVPSAVANEIQLRGKRDPAARAIEETPWLLIVETPLIPELILAWDLGKGESSVLAWAYTHPGSEAILDDLPARRCAAVLGIPVRGTLGLVLTAKKTGRIPAARPILEKLRHSGMYLSDRVLDEALALVGE